MRHKAHPMPSEPTQPQPRYPQEISIAGLPYEQDVFIPCGVSVASGGASVCRLESLRPDEKARYIEAVRFWRWPCLPGALLLRQRNGESLARHKGADRATKSRYIGGPVSRGLVVCAAIALATAVAQGRLWSKTTKGPAFQTVRADSAGDGGTPLAGAATRAGRYRAVPSLRHHRRGLWVLWSTKGSATGGASGTRLETRWILGPQCRRAAQTDSRRARSTL